MAMNNPMMLGHTLMLHPEALDYLGDPKLWDCEMATTLLVYGARYVDFNGSLSKMWKDPDQLSGTNMSALLLRITRHSPSALNRNSRFLNALTELITADQLQRYLPDLIEPCSTMLYYNST